MTQPITAPCGAATTTPRRSLSHRWRADTADHLPVTRGRSISYKLTPRLRSIHAARNEAEGAGQELLASTNAETTPPLLKHESFRLSPREVSSCEAGLKRPVARPPPACAVGGLRGRHVLRGLFRLGCGAVFQHGRAAARASPEPPWGLGGLHARSGLQLAVVSPGSGACWLTTRCTCPAAGFQLAGAYRRPPGRP